MPFKAGSVEVLGGDMRDREHRLAVCPRIAYMPQGLGKNLYPTLSVFENSDFFARLFGYDRRNGSGASTSCSKPPRWRLSRIGPPASSRAA